MEAYVRHLFVMGPAVKVRDRRPQAVPPAGLLRREGARLRRAAQRRISRSTSPRTARRSCRATVFDIAQNPFKPDLDKLKTQFEPELRHARRAGGAGGVQRFPVPLLQGRGQDAAHEPAERLSQAGAAVLQGLSARTDPPVGQAGGHRRALRLPPEPRRSSGTITTGFTSTRRRSPPENLKAKVLEWAKGKEIDALQLGRCMDTKATEAEVNRNIAEAKALNVNSTPTLFVNGRRLVGRLDWPTLRSIIDYEIEYQKTAKNAGEDCGCEVKLPLPGHVSTAHANAGHMRSGIAGRRLCRLRCRCCAGRGVRGPPPPPIDPAAVPGGREVPGLAASCRGAAPERRSWKRRPTTSRGSSAPSGSKPLDGKSYLQAFNVTTNARLGKDNRLRVYRERRARPRSKFREDFIPFNFSASGEAVRAGGLRRLRHHRARVRLRRLRRPRRQGQDRRWSCGTSRRSSTRRASSPAGSTPSTRSSPARPATPRCTARAA